MKIDFERSNKLFYSIKEVAGHFNLSVPTLRFWETEFDTIRPRKTEGGTRQYTRDDISDIATVYHWVKEKGMTLDGARQTLSQKKDETDRKLEVIDRLEKIRNELRNMEGEFDL